MSDADTRVRRPRANDVVLGRGERGHGQPGHVAYRELIWSHAMVYRQSTVEEKHALAKGIVLHIQQKGGRFLERPDFWDHCYHVLSPDAAAAKTRTVLTSRARTMSMKQSHEPLPSDTVSEISDLDVIVEDERVVGDHPGIDTFRTVLSAHQESYEEARSYCCKLGVIRTVVTAILQSGGEFIEYTASNECSPIPIEAYQATRLEFEAMERNKPPIVVVESTVVQKFEAMKRRILASDTTKTVVGSDASRTAVLETSFTTMDVLVGDSKHCGDVSFQAMVRSITGKYQQSSKKSDFVQQVVADLSYTGHRFFQWTESSNCFTVVSKRVAIEKTREALDKNRAASATNDLELLPMERLTDHDVWLDRGIGTEHPGNVAFRKLLVRHQRQFEESKSRAAKLAVATTIVDFTVKSGGQFILLSCQNFYAVVSMYEAYRKTMVKLMHLERRNVVSRQKAKVHRAPNAMPTVLSPALRHAISTPSDPLAISTADVATPTAAKHVVTEDDQNVVPTVVRNNRPMTGLSELGTERYDCGDNATVKAQGAVCEETREEVLAKDAHQLLTSGTIRDLDVILDQASVEDTHPGNASFQELLLLHERAYAGSNSGTEKLNVARAVADWVVKSGGRFIRRVSDDSYRVVPMAVAYERTRQELAHQVSRRKANQDVMTTIDENNLHSTQRIVTPGNDALALGVTNSEALAECAKSHGDVCNMNSVVENSTKASMVDRVADQEQMVPRTKVGQLPVHQLLLMCASNELPKVQASPVKATRLRVPSAKRRLALESTTIRGHDQTDTLSGGMNLLVPASLAHGDVAAQRASVKVKSTVQSKDQMTRLALSAKDITELDVLLGRGKCIDMHPGNISFRRIVHSHRDAYLGLSSLQKSSLVEKVVNHTIDKGGRFVQRGSGNDDAYHVVSVLIALQKTGQALREKKKVRGLCEDSPDGNKKLDKQGSPTYIAQTVAPTTGRAKSSDASRAKKKRKTQHATVAKDKGCEVDLAQSVMPPTTTPPSKTVGKPEAIEEEPAIYLDDVIVIRGDGIASTATKSKTIRRPAAIDEEAAIHLDDIIVIRGDDIAATAILV